MKWEQVLDYLYHAAPTFQNIGVGAYKEGLETTHALDRHFGSPHRRYRTIHVAGTNGKGSVSSTLAAVLQSAGLRVGLYTSPHLVDFRERIRVNGKMIPRRRVVDFVTRERAFFEPLHPSFFELTTALAFQYFAEQQVDVAVVEVGLGGRLDCTNIIHPDLCVITNISYDHQQLLGSTLPQIAAEKAGIIKAGVPVVVGQTEGNVAVHDVFLHMAESLCPPAPIRFADEHPIVTSAHPTPDGGMDLKAPNLFLPSLTGEGSGVGLFHFALGGLYQQYNANTILTAIDVLAQQPYYRDIFATHPQALNHGFVHVVEMTGLRGRWQRLQEHPTVICDAGHNVAGIRCVAQQLSTLRQTRSRGCFHIVFGMVDDKDHRSALALLPTDAVYYFTQPSSKRAFDAAALAAEGAELGLNGQPYPTVAEAYSAALAAAADDDVVFVGGSCYVVADLLQSLNLKL